MKNFWSNKRVLVTGGTGFIGSYVVELLLKKHSNIAVITQSGDITNISHVKNDVEIIHADLRDFSNAVKSVKRRDIVINLASTVAGIQYNISHPATMFVDTVQIAKNMIEAALDQNVERFLMVSSACVYPRKCTIPTPETEGFLDDPEPTNLGYGWAKRTSELLGRFYHMEYGMKVAIVRPYNAYGPRDNFDPKISHVIPGLIQRVLACENPLVVWGSGRQTRSFLYAEDFANGIIDTIEKYPVADPVNIGADEEIAIADLAKMIVEISGIKTKIVFDTSKPDGQPRRKCDTKKAKEKVGFTARVSLEEGLQRTILWYKQRLLS